ncbi:trk system potassium uptake protein TrkH [Limimonas halophila]|uniref:Trk system potassium uptake protein n=1 Tax=Limimonas halophila TaxID=1082479 RepID=A0A1G7U1W6_9PROT|nr:TrkH family potassium uptake protein [Limimonas halophila]SDG41301.1 trk system potassium uptake protein TrkH [Limimonas halophila]
MIDLRPVLFVIGILLSVLAAAMLVPAAVDLGYGNPDWQVFLASAAVTVFVGVSLILTTRTGWEGFNIRQAFLMTALAWVAIAFFGALPLVFSRLGLGFTDAVFEAMSGVTTTGSTVMSGLNDAPPGILIWRAGLQWLGGVGIIVVALAVLPVLRVGGMQMFRVEAFDADKVLPRAAQLAAGIAGIYIGLTLLIALGYGAFGMSGFDAIAHAMTSIATGGYGNYDSSFGQWTAPGIHYVGALAMIAGSLPFVQYLRAVRGDVLALARDRQIQWFLGILLAAAAVACLSIWDNGHLPWPDAIRHGLFNVVSLMTGTGYASADFGAWGSFIMVQALILMFIGGCAGSTTCGIKIFRFQIVYAEAQVQVRRLMHPNGVFIPYYNRRPIPDRVAQAVMGFFFVYMMSFAVLAMLLGLLGLDVITAISGAATAISNVGPGLGPVIGPDGNFAPLPDPAKWLLCFGMLLGRLELFTVLVLFAPSFWRG